MVSSNLLFVFMPLSDCDVVHSQLKQLCTPGSLAYFKCMNGVGNALTDFYDSLLTDLDTNPEPENANICTELCESVMKHKSDCDSAGIGCFKGMFQYWRCALDERNLDLDTTAFGSGGTCSSLMTQEDEDTSFFCGGHEDQDHDTNMA